MKVSESSYEHLRQTNELLFDTLHNFVRVEQRFRKANQDLARINRLLVLENQYLRKHGQFPKADVNNIPMDDTPTDTSSDPSSPQTPLLLHEEDGEGTENCTVPSILATLRERSY